MNFQILTHKVVHVHSIVCLPVKVETNKQMMLPVFSVLQRVSSLKGSRGSYSGSSGARLCSMYRAGAAFCYTSYSEAFHLHFLPEVKLRGRIDERSEPPGGISVFHGKVTASIFSYVNREDAAAVHTHAHAHAHSRTRTCTYTHTQSADT